MARQVIKTAHGPYEVRPQKQSVFICMCGLSKNQPFCDSSHKKTLDEADTTYVYDAAGHRTEACSECAECEGCDCGSCCGTKEDKPNR